MEIKAYIKRVRISPKKLRFLLDDVKKMKPVEALDALLYSPKRGAKILRKAIKSAIDNAVNNYKIKESLLKFKTLLVENGGWLKRFRPGGRGTVKPFKRRMAHIKIILTAEEQTKDKTELKVVPKMKKEKQYGSES